MLTLIVDIIIQSEPEKQDKDQILVKIFYNVSDSESKFLQRVRFSNNYFKTRQILKKRILESTILRRKLILKSTILNKKNTFKKHDFEEKNTFEKQILTKVLHTKNHVLTQFTP